MDDLFKALVAAPVANLQIVGGLLFIAIAVLVAVCFFILVTPIL